MQTACTRPIAAVLSDEEGAPVVNSGEKSLRAERSRMRAATASTRVAELAVDWSGEGKTAAQNSWRGPTGPGPPGPNFWGANGFRLGCSRASGCCFLGSPVNRTS